MCIRDSSRFEQALKDAGFEAKVWVHTRAERETRAHMRKQMQQSALRACRLLLMILTQ